VLDSQALDLGARWEPKQALHLAREGRGAAQSSDFEELNGVVCLAQGEERSRSMRVVDYLVDGVDGAVAQTHFFLNFIVAMESIEANFMLGIDNDTRWLLNNLNDVVSLHLVEPKKIYDKPSLVSSWIQYLEGRSSRLESRLITLGVGHSILEQEEGLVY